MLQYFTGTICIDVRSLILALHSSVDRWQACRTTG